MSVWWICIEGERLAIGHAWVDFSGDWIFRTVEGMAEADRDSIGIGVCVQHIFTDRDVGI